MTKTGRGGESRKKTFLPFPSCPFGFQQRLHAQAAEQLHHVAVKSGRYLARDLDNPVFPFSPPGWQKHCPAARALTASIRLGPKASHSRNKVWQLGKSLS